MADCWKHGACRDSFCQRCQDILENEALRAELDRARPVLEACSMLPEWVLKEMASPEDAQDARPYYVALGRSELARRAAKEGA